MSEHELQREPDAVCETWQRFVQAALGIALLVGTGLLLHFYAPAASDDGLKAQVAQLNRQIQQLKEQQEQQQQQHLVGLLHQVPSDPFQRQINNNREEEEEERPNGKNPVTFLQLPLLHNKKSLKCEWHPSQC